MEKNRKDNRNPSHVTILAEELSIRQEQVSAVIRLLNDGCTIPFIARYRKEQTGSLDDAVLRKLYDRLQYLKGLDERKETVLAAIAEQGKLTKELAAKIRAASVLAEVEDLYRPYQKKRRTRAGDAREAGLEPLAEIFLAPENRNDPAFDPEREAERFLNPEKKIHSASDAVQGALDIIAEQISDDASIRTLVRTRVLRDGILTSRAKDPDIRSVYEHYYDFSVPVRRAAGHQILAINRGEREKLLTVQVEVPEEEVLESVFVHPSVGFRRNDTRLGRLLRAAAKDSYDRLISPSVEREVRTSLTEQAEAGAIRVFGENLRQLLLQPPIAGETVLGWDPAFRTGCKLAVVDPTGKVLDTAVIYPTAPTSEEKKEQARKTLQRLLSAYHVRLISVGNGTASRESEQFLAEFLKSLPEPVSYVITNEAGASVYSASELASREMPEYDVGQRSAASIARRVQDPLAELVKIDPKAIGVGQYQHDMNQKRLGEALGAVVEDCVNSVGIDLNTASAELLRYVSGISKTVAERIVAYREETGPFDSRKELLAVPGLGPKAYEQCAGFLRIRNGSCPLDNTGIHPESYKAARALLTLCGQKEADLRSGAVSLFFWDYTKAAGDLGIGEPTLRDIVAELKRPGRDPREDLPLPVLRSDVLSMEDLKAGMKLKGTVRNIVDFGAFVDIGVHEDGLVHISQMAKDRFVKHPLDVVHVGDVIEVRVLSVDPVKKRIALSMIPENC